MLINDVGDLTLEQYAAAQRTVTPPPPLPIANQVAREVLSEAQLSDFVFVNYTKTRRPRRDALDLVEVYFGLSLIVINHILEKDQQMVTTIHLTLQWRDDYLVWNNSERFSQITSLSVFANEVWLPDYSNVNSGDMYTLAQMSSMMLLTINNDGWIEYLPEATITTFCDLDLTYFPYDVQMCPIRFEAWTYFPQQEMFRLYDPPTNTHKFRQNEEWDLLSLTVKPYISCYTNSTSDCCYTGIEYQIRLSRKAAYYNINIIAPSLIIAFVEVTIFAIPTHESMKIHISFTCLLAYAVFQNTISAELPRSSEHPPLLSIFINLQMAYIGVALFGEAGVFMCENRAARREPVYHYLLLVAEILGRYLFIDEESIIVVEDAEDTAENTEAAIQEIKKVFVSKEPGLSGGIDDEGVFGQHLWHENDVPSYSTLYMPHEYWHHSGNKIHPNATHYLDDPKYDHKKKARVDPRLANKYRFQWLFLAEVADRITMIIYFLLISITPLVMFLIMPATNNTNKH